MFSASRFRRMGSLPASLIWKTCSSPKSGTGTRERSCFYTLLCLKFASGFVPGWFGFSCSSSALLIFGAVSTDHMQVGGALSNTFHNAPFVIENFYSFIGLLTLLMSTAFVNSAAIRDFSNNTYQIIFSTPLRRIRFSAGPFYRRNADLGDSDAWRFPGHSSGKVHAMG